MIHQSLGQMPQHLDVAVVGGGAAGLAAAAYLARANRTVLVLEQSSTLGGRAVSSSRNGFVFNRGIHALYRDGAATRVLAQLDVAYSGGSPSAAYALTGGNLFPIPTSFSKLLRTRLLTVGDKLGLARLFRSIPSTNPADLAGTSVVDWSNRAIRSHRARSLVQAFARTLLYTASIDVASADVFVERLQLALRQPVLYIDGGWQTLVDGLQQSAAQAGAAVRTGAHVERVDSSPRGGVTLHLMGGGTVAAGAAIFAVGPRDVLKMLSDVLPSDCAAGLRRAVPAEVACLDVALSSEVSSRYPAIQDLDSARFLATQSRYARMAPQGGVVVQTAKQRHYGESNDPTSDQQALEALIEVAQPGWRKHEVDRVFLPRMEASSLIPTAATGGMPGRPGCTLPGVHHCYAAGDWVGPEGYLLDASLASARRAAETVLNELQPGSAASAVDRPVALGLA
jgi:phytoene dehydrogenase-like protein